MSREESLRTTSRKVWDTLNDILLADAVSSAKRQNTVSTGLSATSTKNHPSLVRDLVFSRGFLTIITDLNITETKGYCRERKRTFWQKLWDSFWCSISPWPYTPIEFYTEAVPAMMYDIDNKVIYCHPALKREVEKIVNSGGFSA